jgi:hypothetical protein
MIVSSGSRFTFGEALKTTVLLLPQALLACLTAAFFFSLVLYCRDERPAGATVVPSLIAGTLLCVILASLLSAVVGPRANEAYRSLVFETLERRAGVYAPASPVEPARGASEMTWFLILALLVPRPSSTPCSHSDA